MNPSLESIVLAPWSRVRAFRQHSPGGFSFDLHAHNELELVRVEEGAGQLFLGNAASPFLDGDVVAIDPNVVHAFGSHCDSSAVVVQFSAEALIGFGLDSCSPAARRGATGVVFRSDQYGRLRQLFDRAVDAWRPVETPEQGLRQRALLFEILAELNGLPVHHASTAERSVPSPGKRAALNRVLRFVQKRHGRETTLTEAAAVAGMRPESLCRFVKRHLGMTFTQYVNEVRLHSASRSLATSRDRISYIAAACGFPNLSYFNRRFKERFGETPAEFRRAGSA